MACAKKCRKPMKHRFPLENKITGGAAYEEYSDK